MFRDKDLVTKIGFSISAYIDNKEAYDDMIACLADPKNDWGCMRHLADKRRKHERYQFTSIVLTNRIPKVYMLIEDLSTGKAIEAVEVSLIDVGAGGFRIGTDYFKSEKDIKTLDMTFVFKYVDGRKSIISGSMKSIIGLHKVREEHNLDEEQEII